MVLYMEVLMSVASDSSTPTASTVAPFNHCNCISANCVCVLIDNQNKLIDIT